MAGEMLACAGLRRGPITSARAGCLATRPAPINSSAKLIAECKNRLCCVLKMSPDCSPRRCNTDSAKLPVIVTMIQTSSGGRSHIICKREPETTTKSTSFEHVLAKHSLRSKARQRTQHSDSWCQNMSGSNRTKAHRRLAHERFMWHTFDQAVQSCTTVPLSLDKPKHLNRTATHTAMSKNTTKARPPNCQ